MKLTTTKEHLLNALSTLAGVIEKKQTMPILSNVLITHTGERATMTGTDLEIEMVASCLADSDPAGFSATVPFAKLYGIVKLLPTATPIAITVTVDKATLKAGKSRFTLSVLPPESYPSFEVNAKQAVTVPSSALKKAIGLCAHAMAKQDVRYYLNGLCVQVGDGKMDVIASDGHRLATATVPCADDVQTSLIVPRKAALELFKLLPATDEPVELLFSSNVLSLTVGTVRFSTKLIEGRYPDMARVMPSSTPHVVNLDAELFKQTLTRAVSIHDDSLKPIAMTATKDGIEISAESADHDSSSEPLEATVGGKGFSVGFNANYLLDVLAQGNGTVSMSFPDAMNTCLMVFESESSFRALVMPMKL